MRVTVFPGAPRLVPGFAKGSADNPLSPKGKPVDLYPREPLIEALSRRYSDDAHFQAVSIRFADDDPAEDEGEADQPRINLSGARILEAEGFIVEKALFAYDLDRPGHGAFDSPREREEVTEAVHEALPGAVAVYGTRAGVRALFVLAEAVPFSEAAAYQNWHMGHVERALHDANIDLAVDPGSVEPNRFFRLPWVVRDDEPLYDAPLLIREDRPYLDLSGALPQPTPRRAHHGDAPEFPDKPAPAGEWVACGLEAWRTAKTLPDDGEPTPDGKPSPGRDPLLASLVGRAARNLGDGPDTAFAIWRVLAPLVERTNEAGSSLDLDKLWAMIGRFVDIEAENPPLPSGKRILRLSGDEDRDGSRLAELVMLERGPDSEKPIFVNALGELCGVHDGHLRRLGESRWRAVAASLAAVPSRAAFRPIPLGVTQIASVHLSDRLPRVIEIAPNPPVDAEGRPRTHKSVKDGVYFDPGNRKFPALMEPKRALSLWRKLLSGYLKYRPNNGFLEEEDFNAYLAWLVGATIRPHIRTLPLLVVDANIRGAGKSLLLDIAATVLDTVRSGGRWPRDEHQWDLDLRTWALAGRRFIWFDNVPPTTPIGGAALDRALTGTHISGRNLHSTDHSGDIPFRPAIAASSNNAEIVGDTQRRALRVRLHRDPSWTRPRSFDAAGLLSRVREAKESLYIALVSLARARKIRPQSERKVRDRPLWPSFEEFDRWAGGAVTDITGVDFIAGAEKRAVESDPKLGALDALADLLRRTKTSTQFTAADVRTMARASPDLDEGLSAVFDVKTVRDMTPNRVTRTLRGLAGLDTGSVVLTAKMKGRRWTFTLSPSKP